MKILFAASPFLALGAFVVLVDPFNYFRLSRAISDATKHQNVYSINPVLWDTFSFVREPCPNIILGDSRAQLIPVDYLERRTGRPHKTLTATAAKINEIIDYFWLADSRIRLEKVYIVLNFNMFNYFAFANRVEGAVAATKNPFLYIYDRSVMHAAWLVTRAVLRGRGAAPGRPRMSKDEFWSWALQALSFQQYGKWKYPEREYERLKAISAHCREKGIDVVDGECPFIFLPGTGFVHGVHRFFRRLAGSLPS